MMADMEDGKIGIIITKDLSRLGRNQLHTGLYIEERFPQFGVRYIAINDNVDTENAESNDLMPFKNLFNEWFVRDTSRKIRAVQRAKAQHGERFGIRAPYGYKKDGVIRAARFVDGCVLRHFGVGQLAVIESDQMNDMGVGIALPSGGLRIIRSVHILLPDGKRQLAAVISNTSVFLSSGLPC